MSSRTASNHDITIGRRMRAARLAAKMTQEDLANVSGVKFQQIQKYETGMNRVCAARLFTIAKALRIEIDHFAMDATSSTVMDDPMALRAANIVAGLRLEIKPHAIDLLESLTHIADMAARAAK